MMNHECTIGFNWLSTRSINVLSQRENRTHKGNMHGNKWSLRCTLRNLFGMYVYTS